MVKIFGQLALLMWLAVSGMALAATGFAVSADKKTIMLGEPLTVVLTAVDARQPLNSVKLDKLKQHFDVFSIAGNVQTQMKKGRGSRREILTLVLYPLHTGKLQLPVLHLSGKNSRSLPVTVLEPGAQGQRVIFRTNLDIAKPVVREVVTLTLEILDDGTRQWAAPQALITSGFNQRKLAESQREETLDGTRYTVHHYAWALMPLREGELGIVFPMLDTFKFGSRLRYPLAPLNLNVTAAPAYLPVHVPVGNLVVTVEAMPAEIALQQPVNWILNIQGKGLSATGVAKLLESIPGSETLHFYPASISIDDKARQPTALQNAVVTLPFIPLRTGTLSLPEINIPYYDTARAKISSVYLPAVSVAVYNPVWRIAQKIGLGLLILSATLALVLVMLKKLRQSLKRRNALRTIRQAATAEELHRALLNFESETLQNRTLQQWLQHMRQFYTVDRRLVNLVARLESMQYAVAGNAVFSSGLANEAAMLLQQCRAKVKGKLQ